MDCGNFVSVDDQDFLAAPAINIIFEHFKDDTVASLREFKKGAGDGLIVGILTGEDLHDPLVMDKEFQWRRDAFMEAIEFVDFVWTLLPNTADYSEFTDVEKVFWFELGYSERLRTISRTETFDTDVFLPGHLYPYRQRVVEALQASGVRVRVSNYQMPIHVYRSVAGRSKVILDVARDKGLRFLSSSRILLGINNSIPVVSEKFDETPLNYFYNYAVTAESDNLVEACIQCLQNPSRVMRGEEATATFKTEHPMAEKTQQLLNDCRFLDRVIR